MVAAVCALAVALLATSAPHQARAASDSPITIALTATVASVDDSANLLWGAIQPGDTVTGTYTSTAATSDTNPLLSVGDYWHTTAPYGMNLTVGGRVFETDPQHVSMLMEIANNHAGRDGYLVRSYNNRRLSNGLHVTGIEWCIEDPSQTALKNDALPKTAPKLSSWQSTYGLQLEGSDAPDSWDANHFFIRAHVTQVQKITR
jgi:hypothetical protein